MAEIADRPGMSDKSGNGALTLGMEINSRGLADTSTPIVFQALIRAVGKTRHRVIISPDVIGLKRALGTFLSPKTKAVWPASGEIGFRGSSTSIMPSVKKAYSSLYVACSCGKANCEHIEIAVNHFRMVEAFSQNTSGIVEAVQRLEHESRIITKDKTGLENNLVAMRSTLDQLSEELEQAKVSGSQRVTELNAQIAELGGNRAAIEQTVLGLQTALETKEREIQQHQKNYKSIAGALGGSVKVVDAPILDGCAHQVLNQYFMPPACAIPAEAKLKNITGVSNHHLAENAMRLAVDVAKLTYIKDIAVGRREQCKVGKVCVSSQIGQLELILPSRGTANRLLLQTTAETTEQHLFVARLLADHFNVECV